MFIKTQHNSTAVYTLTRDTSCASAGQDHIGSYIVKDVFIHNPGNINNWESITRRGPLLHGVVITAMWAVLGDICNLEL
jgi:hypothetical protein